MAFEMNPPGPGTLADDDPDDPETDSSHVLPGGIYSIESMRFTNLFFGWSTDFVADSASHRNAPNIDFHQMRLMIQPVLKEERLKFACPLKIMLQE